MRLCQRKKTPIDVVISVVHMCGMWETKHVCEHLGFLPWTLLWLMEFHSAAEASAQMRQMVRYVRNRHWENWTNKKRNRTGRLDTKWMSCMEICGLSKLRLSRKSARQNGPSNMQPSQGRGMLNGSVAQERIGGCKRTRDDRCQMCGALGTEVQRLHECRHWRRIRSDLTDEARKYEQLATASGSAMLLWRRGMCCFSCAVVIFLRQAGWRRRNVREWQRL